VARAGGAHPPIFLSFTSSKRPKILPPSAVKGTGAHASICVLSPRGGFSYWEPQYGGKQTHGSLPESAAFCFFCVSRRCAPWLRPVPGPPPGAVAAAELRVTDTLSHTTRPLHTKQLRARAHGAAPGNTAGAFFPQPVHPPFPFLSLLSPRRRARPSNEQKGSGK